MALTNSEGGRTFHFNFSLSENLLASLRGDNSCSSSDRDCCETEILLMSKCLSVSFGSLICKATQEPYPTVDMSNGSTINPSSSAARYPNEAEDQSAFEPLDLSVYNQDDPAAMCVQSEPSSNMIENPFAPRFGANTSADVKYASSHIVMHKNSMGSNRKRPLSPISKLKNHFDGKIISERAANAAEENEESFPDIRDHKSWNRWSSVGLEADASSYKRECSDDSNPADLNLDSDIIHSSTSLVSNEYFALVNNSNQHKLGSNSRENDVASGSSTSFATSESGPSNSGGSSGDKRQFRLSEWERTNFRCSICGKMFKHLTNVSRHKRMIHNANHDSPALCIDATESSAQEFNSVDNSEVPEEGPIEDGPKVQQGDEKLALNPKEPVDGSKTTQSNNSSVNNEDENQAAENLPKPAEVLKPPVFDPLPFQQPIVKSEGPKPPELNDWVDYAATSSSKLPANTSPNPESPRFYNIPAVCSSSSITPSKSTSTIFHPTDSATPDIFNDVTDNSSYLFDRLGSDYQSCSTKALLSLIMDLNKSNAAGVAGSPPLASSNMSHTSDSSHSITSPIDATLSMEALNEVKKKLGSKSGMPRKLKKPVPKNTYEYSKVRLPFPIEISAEERVSLACNVCNYQFTILSNLRRHKKVYGHYEKHICPNCKEIFTSMERFNAHVSNCKSSKTGSGQVNGRIGIANNPNDFSDSSVDIDKGVDNSSYEMKDFKAEASDEEFGEDGNSGKVEGNEDSPGFPLLPAEDTEQNSQNSLTQDETDEICGPSTE